MAGFFENLSATIGNGAKNALDKGKEFKDAAIDKGKELKDVASIKSQISSAQSGMNKLYKELGEAYFNDHKDSSEFPEITEGIKNAICKIQELEDKLMEAQGASKCPSCGAAIAKDSKFCPSCGVPVDIARTAAEEAKEETEDENNNITIE